jgi:hypothetical protein
MKNSYCNAGFFKRITIFVFLVVAMFASNSAFSEPSCDFLSGRASEAIKFYEYVLSTCVARGHTVEECFALTEAQHMEVRTLIDQALECHQ